MKTIIASLLLTVTPCQKFVIDNWPRYGVSAWAVACMDTCEIVTFADVNNAAIEWIYE